MAPHERRQSERAPPVNKQNTTRTTDDERAARSISMTERGRAFLLRLRSALPNDATRSEIYISC